nr:DNA helicase [Tanacetum cinerariifolium]
DFLKVQTAHGIFHPTCRAACEALGLLGDDTEWDITMQEACASATSSQLRSRLPTNTASKEGCFKDGDYSIMYLRVRHVAVLRVFALTKNMRLSRPGVIADELTLQQKAIVCPKNETADTINSKVLEMVYGEATTYLSHDEAMPLERDEA